MTWEGIRVPNICDIGMKDEVGGQKILFFVNVLYGCCVSSECIRLYMYMQKSLFIGYIYNLKCSVHFSNNFHISIPSHKSSILFGSQLSLSSHPAAVYYNGAGSEVGPNCGVYWFGKLNFVCRQIQLILQLKFPCKFYRFLNYPRFSFFRRK